MLVQHSHPSHLVGPHIVHVTHFLVQVKPYHFDFICSVKKRNQGQNIIDIFSHEFPARDRQYYISAVARGTLRIDKEETSDPTKLLHAGTTLRHLVHRHEPPVPAGNIQLLGSTAHFVAINKPYGMPVHAVGNYRKNTVLGVLTAENPELGELFPVHRLDKPVSGVLLFARSRRAADALRQGIANKSVEKVYIARVQGVFPSGDENSDAEKLQHQEEQKDLDADGKSLPRGVTQHHETPLSSSFVTLDACLAWDTTKNHALAIEKPPIIEESMKVNKERHTSRNKGSMSICEEGAFGISISKKQKKFDDTRTKKRKIHGQFPSDEEEDDESPSQETLHSSATDASESDDDYAFPINALPPHTNNTQQDPLIARKSITLVRLLSVAPDRQTSLVECRPLTGRSHQIRAHLAWYGYPIANDHQYGGVKYRGPVSLRSLAEKMGMAWKASTTTTLDGGTTGNRDGGDMLQHQERRQVAKMTAEASMSPSTMEAALVLRNLEEFEISTGLRDPLCCHCPYYAPKDYPVNVQPLWLHARHYGCHEWSFEAPLPDWAEEHFEPSLLAG